MSKGKKAKRTVSRGKKKATFRWSSEWTLLWVLGGFGLSYFVFIPLQVHPLHWLFAFLGGVAGYGVGLFVDAGLHLKVVRFVRHGSGTTTR